MSEVIDTFGNGEVFERYEPEAAYDAILKVSRNYDTYTEAVKAARENFKTEYFVAVMLSVIQAALIKRSAECNSTPVARSQSYPVSLPVTRKLQTRDFDEIQTLLNTQSQKRIDIAREALREHRFIQAFRVSASALKETPSSSLHYAVLKKAITHLNEPYQTRFAELEALHRQHKAKVQNS